MLVEKICLPNNNTVKLGYNELGYNEHSVIANKNIYLVGFGHFYVIFSRLWRTKPGYNEQNLNKSINFCRKKYEIEGKFQYFCAIFTKHQLKL